jgi:2'-deoxynucleoside 5'-phosphate N-hydrolase
MDKKLKLYFGGSISGGRGFVETYRKMVEHLKEAGHLVLTEHVADPGVMELEKDHTPEQIYSRDIQWLKESDGLVTEVSNPSLGVGYEICYALRIGKPVLCLYKNGIFLSRLISGNTSEGIFVHQYSKDSEWREIIDDFINRIPNGS